MGTTGYLLTYFLKKPRTKNQSLRNTCLKYSFQSSKLLREIFKEKKSCFSPSNLLKKIKQHENPSQFKHHTQESAPIYSI